MHNRAGRKLRRTTSHRLAMFSNQLDSLMTHERIQTTLSKAKELRPLAEKLITAAKNDGIAARRKVAQWIPDRSTVKKVFETIAPRFVDRPGGYTRILRLGARKGDAAEAAILEFVDYRFEPKEKGPRKESLSDRARRASGGRVETVRKEKPEAPEGGSEEVPAAERKTGPRKPRPTREGKPSKAAKTGPKKGPSRTGPSKRGA
ncbi:MAG: 50S ribosomal protein L17 [Acidobacteriota bacterium]|nr:50S ribosomal protein L17 [Acidobacteriota bacterium]MDQ2980307.1 50S ribosomal protein L17 [Acidobacteriota bacterium]